jgi:hypothetical protein
VRYLAGAAAAFEKNFNKHLPSDQPVAFPHAEVESLFRDIQMLAPGVVRVSEWHPAEPGEPAATTLWGGVGRTGRQ